MGGIPLVMQLAHAVLCARDLDEAQVAFAALCEESLVAAAGTAAIMTEALPATEPLWAAILNGAVERKRAELEFAMLGEPGPVAGIAGFPAQLEALFNEPGPVAGKQAGPTWWWNQRDPADTAEAIEGHMGWGRSEKGE